MQEKPIKDNIVKKLGGTGIVAHVCGITAGAVSQWGNYIPPRHARKIMDFAKKQNIEIAPDDFFDAPTRKRKNNHG